jgi:hypothetical protein
MIVRYLYKSALPPKITFHMMKIGMLYPLVSISDLRYVRKREIHSLQNFLGSDDKLSIGPKPGTTNMT